MQVIFFVVALLLCTACSSPSQPPVISSASNTSSDERNQSINNLVMYAISLADIGYLYGGNTPESGFDCSGLVQHVFKESAHIVLPRTSLEMSRIGQAVDADELRPGDLVFFNTLQQNFSHVGIYVGEDKFVHAPKTGKQIHVANLREKYWSKRYNGARRISF